MMGEKLGIVSSMRAAYAICRQLLLPKGRTLTLFGLVPSVAQEHERLF
jgi:hypothetical protein